MIQSKEEYDAAPILDKLAADVATLRIIHYYLERYPTCEVNAATERETIERIEQLLKDYKKSRREAR